MTQNETPQKQCSEAEEPGLSRDEFIEALKIANKVVEGLSTYTDFFKGDIKKMLEKGKAEEENLHREEITLITAIAASIAMRQTRQQAIVEAEKTISSVILEGKRAIKYALLLFALNIVVTIALTCGCALLTPVMPDLLLDIWAP